MERPNNQQSTGNTNVELTLLGIDKKWVRYDGTWVDKSTIPSKKKEVENTSLISEEIEGNVSPWWQFWKA